MNRLAHDLRQLVAEFPGDWKESGYSMTLIRPGHTVRVGPNGFSGSTGGGALSIGVSIVRDADREPGIGSTPIAFYRALNNDGSITAQGGGIPWRSVKTHPKHTPSATEWLRKSIAEAFAWLEDQKPEPKPETTEGLPASFWDDE